MFMCYKIVVCNDKEWLSNNWLPHVFFDHVHVHGLYAKLLSDVSQESEPHPSKPNLEYAIYLANKYMTFMPYTQKLHLCKDEDHPKKWYLEIPAHRCGDRIMYISVKNKYKHAISHMSLYIRDEKTKHLLSSQNNNNADLVLHPAGLPTIALWNTTLVIEVDFDEKIKNDLQTWAGGWPFVELDLCVFPRDGEQYKADRQLVHGPYPVIRDGIPTQHSLSFRDGRAHPYKSTFFYIFDAFKHPLRYA